MKELFDLSFSPANVFPTILLLFVALYWLVFLVGMLDLSFLDFDLGGHAEVDVDHDIHVDHDADVGKDVSGAGHPNSPGLQILHFLNLGDVPFMIVFSFFALFYWALSILGNHYLTEGRPLLIAGILAGSFIAALLMAKLFTQPLRKMFRNMGKGDAPLNLVGKLCVLELGVESNRLGQAVVEVGDKHLLVSVRSEGGLQIPSGMRCLILEREQGTDIYLVQRFEMEEAPI